MPAHSIVTRGLELVERDLPPTREPVLAQQGSPPSGLRGLALPTLLPAAGSRANNDRSMGLVGVEPRARLVGRGVELEVLRGVVETPRRDGHGSCCSRARLALARPV